jgi:hypothetical protein
MTELRDQLQASLGTVYASSASWGPAGWRRSTMQPSMMAIAAWAARERDKAIAYADRAERERDPLFVLMARLWPGYAPMRQDPRFKAIVPRLNLPEHLRR